MKQKINRLLSLLLCFVMILGFMPAMSMTAFAYTEGEISGTTGRGTESDPVIVDTYAEMKAALEHADDLYIKVVGFDHTTTAGGRTFRELVAGTDYTPGMNEGAIIIPSGKTKHLTIATDIICYAEATTEANSMWTFIHNRGTLYIDGTGKLAVNFNATSQWYGINAIVLNRGELEVSGSVTFDATQDSATPTTAFAIANGNGNTAHTKIYGGTFIASNNSNGALNYGNSYAVGADDGYMWIYGGEFRATPSGTGTGYGAGGTYGKVSLMGGTFEGVYMSPVEAQGKYLSDFLSEGDGVVYRTETGAAFDGSTIKKTTEKVRVVKSEKIITGPVEVSVTAPVAGNTPAMTATTTTANVQSNPACCWYPLDENGNIIISGMLGEADTFEAGKNYAVGVVLLPAEGYEFADTTVVNINGGVAEKSLPTSYKSIQATCYFASEIKAVNMTVSAPEIGKTPNDMTNTYTATGLASGTYWFYASANASGTMMGGETAFVSGNTYSAIYQFKIPDSSNAQFASTITTSDITVNNGTVYAVYRISDKEIQVTVNFLPLHEDIIDEVNMTVSAPQVGKTPNEMTYDATGLASGSNWFYASANASGSIMSGDTAFVSGNTYSAIYQFKIPDGSAAKFAATIGTGDITVNNGTVYAVYRAGDKEIQVTVNFPTLADENIIDTVSMTVSAPEIGKTPNEMTHSATGLTPGGYWFYASANASGTNMSGDTAFVSGNTYSAIYQFTISESSPSKFASTITTSNITVNNGTIYAVNRINDKKIEVTVNFPTLADENIIDTVRMTVSAPEIGKTPDDMTHSATGLTPGAYWFYASANASGTMMGGETAFVSGNTYSAIYQFTISESSPSKFAATIGTGDITVNNGTVYAVNRINDKKIEVTVNFGELKDKVTTIDTIAVTVTAPVAGAAPVVAPAGLPAGVTCEPVASTATGWYDSETDAKMASTDTFVEGKTYYIRLFLSADTGYAFANPVTTATINGDDATIELNNDGYLGIKKSFVASGITTYTVSFDANGGTGTMADVTGVSGSYTLPENGFTEPTNQKFKGWATSATGPVIDGTTIVVEANTTLYAIWENKEYEIAGAEVKVTAPLKGAAPAATGTVSDGRYYVATLDWDPADTAFEAGTAYTVKLDLETSSGYEFTSGTVFKINGNNATVIYRGVDQATISYTFPTTTSESCSHKKLELVKKAATCTGYGTLAHYECVECGQWFEDITGIFVIPEEEKEDYLVDPTGHSFDSEGVCKDCGYKKPSTEIDDDSSDSKREKRSYSNRWVQDARGWWYRNPNGTWPSNGWAYLPWNGSNYWYYFDADGYMVTSWLDWQGNRYYLNPVPGTNSGKMLTGWQLIDGKWYYFNTEKTALEGAMLRNTMTPDGYQVGADGVWIP